VKKTYMLTGVTTAVMLLRPGAQFSINKTNFIEWNDPRPAPTLEEITETIRKIKEFEDSIPSIELE
jgi:hypothetical protein